MSDPSQKSVNRPQSVQTLLQDRRTGFARILAHARVLSRLDGILTAILEPALAEHCQVADYRNGHLVLVCSNATFATRVRMISQQLAESFREEGVSGITSVETRIAPVNRPRPDVRTRRPLSPAAIEALGRFASDSGDAEIQAIFDRIIARRNG